MNSKILAALAAISAGGLAQAAESYNQNVTAIFGGGNPDVGWTVASGGDVSLALRAKQRPSGAIVNDGTDTYFASTGVIPPANNRAMWNWEFSIATTEGTLGNYTYQLGIDTDASAGASYMFVNPMTFWTDNSFGAEGLMNSVDPTHETTENSWGNEYANAAAWSSGGGYGQYQIIQNSQNITFYGQNPFADSTFDYVLRAYSGETLIAETSIQVIVGEGGDEAPVPEPSTVIGGAALGVIALRRIVRRKS